MVCAVLILVKLRATMTNRYSYANCVDWRDLSLFSTLVDRAGCSLGHRVLRSTATDAQASEPIER
jgi:hypothetical protein